MSLPETPGYVAGLERIVDGDHAQQYIALPGTGSRNGADYTAFQKDGVEYLQAGDYLCMDAAAAPALWGGEGAYTTVQPDGYARWYQVGDLAGATLTVELPEAGASGSTTPTGRSPPARWPGGRPPPSCPRGLGGLRRRPRRRFHLSVEG